MLIVWAVDTPQAAIDFGRRKNLVVGLPPGRYRVNTTINLIQMPKMFLTTVSEE